jgi:hypothetical protein
LIKITKFNLIELNWKVSVTLEWLLSTKNSASVRPSPLVTGGALNSSKMPPSPCDWASSESLRPVSANSLNPSLAA